jgi:CDP-diacylglycerol--serine O-phosphatidyltransferase
MSMLRRNLPNYLTCMNLLCGTIGIIAVFDNNLVLSAGLIALASVFDFFDGLVARALRVTSPIGKELDSLADMVSFGVLPSLIFFMLISRPHSFHPSEYLQYLRFVPLLMVLFSAWRLAKFNIDTRQTSSFIGLPTPANALLIAAFPMIIEYDRFNVGHYLLNPWLLAGLSLLLCFLLVAELPLFALKFKNYGFADNKVRYIFIIIAVVLAISLGYLSVPAIILSYIFLSIIQNKFLNSTGPISN